MAEGASQVLQTKSLYLQFRNSIITNVVTAWKSMNVGGYSIK